ncbi:hypothetical protein LCGC14_2881000 [marine sediment metagenome]|uniref:Uncharacterized protein n=1 Tax=marine sediment metagenome TaxID=412755 RepID=A0A0F9A821_9ZZZZ
MLELAGAIVIAVILLCTIDIWMPLLWLILRALLAVVMVGAVGIFLYLLISAIGG